MKTILTLSILFVSLEAMAHTCLISLYDPYNRPVVNFPTKNDVNCQGAARQCYESIRSNRLDPYYYRCYTISMKEDFVRSESPRTTTPITTEISSSTTTDSGNDFKRDIENGETVIYDSKLWVVSQVEKRLLTIKEKNGKEKLEVSRQAVALTRTCARNICTKTSVLSRRSQSYHYVEGIDFQGRYLLREVNRDKDSEDFQLVEPYHAIALTEGCVAPFTGQVCVDNKVIDRRNRYLTVAGIQTDGSIVVRDESGKLIFNQNPATFVVTR